MEVYPNWNAILSIFYASTDKLSQIDRNQLLDMVELIKNYTSAHIPLQSLYT